MSIITQADMLAEFSEAELVVLTDRERLGQLNAERLDKAIADAEDEASKRVLPVDLSAGTPSAYLKRVMCDIARYTLYKDNAPEEVYRRYKAGIDFLNDARQNPDMLGDGYATEVGATSAAQISIVRG